MNVWVVLTSLDLLHTRPWAAHPAGALLSVWNYGNPLSMDTLHPCTSSYANQSQEGTTYSDQWWPRWTHGHTLKKWSVGKWVKLCQENGQEDINLSSRETSWHGVESVDPGLTILQNTVTMFKSMSSSRAWWLWIAWSRKASKNTGFGHLKDQVIYRNLAYKPLSM